MALKLEDVECPSSWQVVADAVVSSFTASVPLELAAFGALDVPVDANAAIKHFTGGIGLHDDQHERLRNTILDNEANVSIVETEIKHLGEHLMTVYRAFSKTLALTGEFERWQTRSTASDHSSSLCKILLDVVEHSRIHAIHLKLLCEEYNSTILRALEDDSMPPRMIHRRLAMFSEATEQSREEAHRDNVDLDELRFEVHRKAETTFKAIESANGDPSNEL
ncbi:hypothetical protein V5O48_019269, partial [Marasmius crinis-equi]